MSLFVRPIEDAGKAFGVSGRTVDFARKVREHGTPELVKAEASKKVRKIYRTLIMAMPAAAEAIQPADLTPC